MTGQEPNNKKEIVVTGFGGQGIVLAGRILGKAAALGDHRESTLVQSYGPESRGGACSAQVIISDGVIHYPYVRKPDILAAMSQAGYEKYADLVDGDGMILIDQDLVKPKPGKAPVFAIPSTRFAEELGRKMMANIIMIGFVVAITNAVSRQAAVETIEKSVPPGTQKKNLEAFSKGYDFGLALCKGREKKAAGQVGA